MFTLRPRMTEARNALPIQPWKSLRRGWPAAMAALLALETLAIPVAAQSYDSWNVILLGRFGGEDRRLAYSDIWGYHAPDGTELAILGSQAGVHFINVTDPAQPAEVLFQPAVPSGWRDFRTYSHYAYAVSEGGDGLMIFDLSNPRRPVLLNGFSDTFDTAHNLGIYEGYAYCAGARLRGSAVGTRILDLADPTSPVDVGSYRTYFHDIYVRDNIAYGSALGSGIVVLDVSDKSNPRLRGGTNYEGSVTHNAWLTDDGTYLLTTDETPSNGHIRIWSVANPAEPVQVAEWSAAVNASVHNVFVQGNYAYASYYTEGLRILDISDPKLPVAVGYFDTYPGASGQFAGDWGVYPFLPSGNILLSDIQSGLFVVRREEGGQAAGFELHAPAPAVAYPGGPGQLYFFFELQNTLPQASSYTISAECPLGWDLTYNTAVNLMANSTELVLVTVTVPAGLAAETMVHLRMCVRHEGTGVSKCASTEPATRVTLQDFSVTRLGTEGAQLRWALHVDPGDRGRMGILRSAADAPRDWKPLAWFALASGSFVDASVEPGRAYVYALGLDGPAGLRILAERTLLAAVLGPSRLVGNWPNPFNPSTRVQFELERSGDVRLRIFDARGRLVDTIAPGILAAGRHGLSWNGRDGAGNPLPSGVYFYEVQSGTWLARDRMILAR